MSQKTPPCQGRDGRDGRDGRGEAIGINHVGAADKDLLRKHLESCADEDYFERAVETAVAAGKTQTREGARYRRLARRRGKAKAQVARRPSPGPS